MYTAAHVKTLRLKLRDTLIRCLPDTDQVDIGNAVEALVPLILQEWIYLVYSDHGPDCACWNCVLALNAELMQFAAILRVNREMAEEHD